LKKFQSDYLVITLGEHGMAIFDKTKENYTHIPTVAREVYDVTGAGDTVISVLTLGMALGENVVDSAKVANLVAGIVVGKVGTATVTPEELLNQFS
jgi:D-beta-D-heptose 7-phosphate kinase/D-beta-D-heptose 1-phosphate adenosyltransferase